MKQASEQSRAHCVFTSIEDTEGMDALLFKKPDSQLLNRTM